MDFTYTGTEKCFRDQVIILIKVLIPWPVCFFKSNLSQLLYKPQESKICNQNIKPHLTTINLGHRTFKRHDHRVLGSRLYQPNIWNENKDRGDDNDSSYQLSSHICHLISLNIHDELTINMEFGFLLCIEFDESLIVMNCIFEVFMLFLVMFIRWFCRLFATRFRQFSRMLEVIAVGGMTHFWQRCAGDDLNMCGTKALAALGTVLLLRPLKENLVCTNEGPWDLTALTHKTIVQYIRLNDFCIHFQFFVYCGNNWIFPKFVSNFNPLN